MKIAAFSRLFAASFFAVFGLTVASAPAFAEVDLSGEWGGRMHEDQPYRGGGPEVGEYLGLPITDGARMKADSWMGSVFTLPERQCIPFAADHGLMDRYLAAEHAFTVDPVDGTKNFVHGSPDHAVMVAEVIGGETVRAWIHQPEHGVTWTAEKGVGTFRDGVRTTTTPVADDDAPRGATSMWSMRDHALPGLPAMRAALVTTSGPE